MWPPVRSKNPIKQTVSRKWKRKRQDGGNHVFVVSVWFFSSILFPKSNFFPLVFQKNHVHILVVLKWWFVFLSTIWTEKPVSPGKYRPSTRRIERAARPYKFWKIVINSKGLVLFTRFYSRNSYFIVNLVRSA